MARGNEPVRQNSAYYFAGDIMFKKSKHSSWIADNAVQSSV